MTTSKNIESEKFDHIAVVLRGQYRMWDYTKERIFYVYEKLAKKIDWYIATWDDTPPEHIARFSKDFKDKNLVHINLTPFHDLYWESFASASYLQNSIVPFVEPNSEKYDVIFDQRTDVLTFRTPKESRTPEIKTNILYTAFPPEQVNITFSVSNSQINFEGLVIDDRGYMCDFETYKFLASRFTIKRDPTVLPEHMLFKFCIENNIQMPGGSWVNHIVIRPEIMNDYPQIPDPYDLEKFEEFKQQCNDSIQRWAQIPKRDRKKIIDKHGLDYRDYEISSSSA